MTDHDHHDTDAGPTEQAGPPATELPPAEHAETPAASSPDDIDEEWTPAPTSRFLKAGWAIILALVVGGLLISMISTFFTSGSSKQAGPDAKPSTTAAVNTPPSAAGATPGFSAYDEKFLSLMTQEGWGCTDNAGVEHCNQQMVGFAHQICSYSGQPVDLIYQYLGHPAFLGPGEERMAIVNAEQAYPNCTLTENP